MVEIILDDMTTTIINPELIREIKLDGTVTKNYYGKDVQLRDIYKSNKCEVIMLDGTKYSCSTLTYHILRAVTTVVNFNPNYLKLPEEMKI